ncbi:MFS general substrate transporter [Penicillium longicatenatum]|uniref:MFS general substrate transporter n=1 Tax=Penicillium longicatenatum TaxID=1561947 RepID=UPI002546A93D|nr:MFS general substrate transporter [Penicillium longicatenatum]KAJ5642865.1 MFS general substrate transporter [Penicillium longicatenatum]
MSSNPHEMTLVAGSLANDPPTKNSQQERRSMDKVYSLDAETQSVTEMGTGEIISSSDYTKEEYKRLTRKIDCFLLPMMFFFYGIQQTDKTSTSIQALFGMENDLALQGQQYQWLTTIFYLAYLVGEFPSVYLLQRFNPGRILSIYMTSWGICLICISAAQSWSQMMALRALQGFFESNISAGFLLLTGMRYRTEEHANRSLFWQSSEGFFSIVCNLILYGIARHVEAYGRIAAWRCISLFLGSLTLAGAVAAFFLLGSPHEVRWLNDNEKRMAAARTFDNQMAPDTTGREWSWPQVIETFQDPQLYFSVATSFLVNIPNGGITTFGSLMYETFGFSDWESMLYGCPRNAVYVVAFLAVGYYTRKVKNQRMWVMIASCIIPFASFLVMSLLPDTPQYKWLKWGMYIINVVFSLTIFLGWSLIPSNVAGRTKQTVVSSMTLIAYCMGNMAGAQVFKTDDAPRYVSGTIACSVCFALATINILAWRSWYVWMNKRRDRLAAESELSKEEQEQRGRELGENNVTDLKNPYSRYTM